MPTAFRNLFGISASADTLRRDFEQLPKRPAVKKCYYMPIS
ncbi:hypothetical protein HMPREF9123_2157 [Neisseria bacilliformis ATCC BAA-1200]|uniref:Uncharacterized protein n=1 Tax=Neisseria bacilliformis ATCC BAA-1200 TaxID=888742 RepID=F2BEK1_9NEIS|nr:hypothetical protein HMPREF9123_2157 [Neisseria bacilliformis ATCC BAA-1200]